MHIRQVLVKAELEKFQQYKDVYNAMKKGKVVGLQQHFNSFLYRDIYTFSSCFFYCSFASVAEPKGFPSSPGPTSASSAKSKTPPCQTLKMQIILKTVSLHLLLSLPAPLQARVLPVLQKGVFLGRVPAALCVLSFLFLCHHSGSSLRCGCRLNRTPACPSTPLAPPALCPGTGSAPWLPSGRRSLRLEARGCRES